MRLHLLWVAILGSRWRNLTGSITSNTSYCNPFMRCQPDTLWLYPDYSYFICKKRWNFVRLCLNQWLILSANKRHFSMPNPQSGQSRNVILASLFRIKMDKLTRKAEKRPSTLLYPSWNTPTIVCKIFCKTDQSGCWISSTWLSNMPSLLRILIGPSRQEDWSLKVLKSTGIFWPSKIYWCFWIIGNVQL